ncbi:MAG: FKBP-type peptidyl-prolyl cis-trans isomerase [Bacteroidetes bacterium]|nr:FKBP-type peptidyl-prolyl cis-trans isomerase [Bacteroidota bacterium]
MKKLALLTLILTPLIYLVGCGKTTQGYVSCTNAPVTDDSAALLDFARSNNITPTKDTSGLYYQVITQGTGATPISTSLVTVSYTGEYLNGTVFTTDSNRQYQLNNLISGWQYGLPKIQAGGRIKLLIPSALAYGCTGSASIAPNTPVFFDVTLVSVQ